MRIRSALAAVFVATALALPAGASAESATRSYHIQTRIVEQAPSVGEFAGSLKLSVTPDGIVSGYYRPDDDARFVSVTGGVTGDRLWLEIGSLSRRPWRFSGTFRNGAIDAVSTGPFFDGGRLTSLNLVGTPQPA